jgi:FkbM family methyltransferase
VVAEPAAKDAPGTAAIVFTRVAVAGSPAVEIGVDPTSGDPVAAWFLDNDWIDEPVQRAFLALVRPGARVLDLGSHLGTFSLAAAALGAEVLAVDANPEHVRLLRASAARNGFSGLHVEHVAISETEGDVAFIERSIHGRLAMDEEDGTIHVPSATVDELLDRRGWRELDAIKLDIEGAEIAALGGMQRLFERGCRPPLVFECNASTLPLRGATIVQLRGVLDDLGYRCLFIDHLAPGRLRESSPDSLQPEPASDYLAYAGDGPPPLPDGWSPEPPLTRAELTTRLGDLASRPDAGYRAYVATLLLDGPAWLRDEPSMRLAWRTLELDIAREVRAACAPAAGTLRAGLDHVDAAQPEDGDLPPRVRMLATALAGRHPSGEPARPRHEPPAPSGPPAFAGLSCHVGAGQALGLLVDDRDLGALLLRVLAGREEIADGTLAVDGRSLLLDAPGAGLEPLLTARENLVLFAAYLGASVPAVRARADELLALARVSEPELALADLPVATAVRLALVVALECTTSEILLIGDLPDPQDDGFSTWARERIAWRRHEGLAVVEARHDPAGFLTTPDRVAWLAGGATLACGHPASVVEAALRPRIGFDR